MLSFFKLNPFVYAFSNRAIRRAFREVIFRRFCCWCCAKKTNHYESSRHQRDYSGSLTTDTSLMAPRQTKSFKTDNNDKKKSKTESNHDPSTEQQPQLHPSTVHSLLLQELLEEQRMICQEISYAVDKINAVTNELRERRLAAEKLQPKVDDLRSNIDLYVKQKLVSLIHLTITETLIFFLDE